MVADKGKKMKVAEKGEEENSQIDEALVLSIEKLQEIQEDLEKVLSFSPVFDFTKKKNASFFVVSSTFLNNGC